MEDVKVVVMPPAEKESSILAVLLRRWDKSAASFHQRKEWHRNGVRSSILHMKEQVFFV